MRQMNLGRSITQTPHDDLGIMVDNLKAFDALDRDTKRALAYMYALSAKDALLTARQVLARAAVVGIVHNDLAVLVNAYLPLFNDDTRPTDNVQPLDTMEDILEVLSKVLRECDSLY